MTARMVPSRTALWALTAGAICVLLALVAGLEVRSAALLAAVLGLVLLALGVTDYVITRKAWREAAPQLSRRLPDALAIGVKSDIQLSIETRGGPQWSCELFDYVDSTLLTRGMPASVTLPGGGRLDITYEVIPTRRGDVSLQSAVVRVRSRLGLCQLLERLGGEQTRRVFPDFAQVARYAWLAGDRRLSELGIKTYQRRGEGTDFKQLAEYRPGDAVRHIDWKATLRIGKPVVREFQDERDQCVMLLIDSGRRMRADEAHSGIGGAFFDHVLNAVMLLAYVALRQGDEVGAMTFGAPAGAERSVAPRKGVSALNFLMAKLYDVQPTPTHTDYVAAATRLLSSHRKRALVVLVTNFRDEDSSELSFALRLLRSRHLVLVASLRERVVNELASQPLNRTDASLEVASAHLYEQSRRDAFNRLAARDALMVDALPERLGVELVNRYHAVKTAGLI
jgi:uncharacterized protein (DUF58 family)